MKTIHLNKFLALGFLAALTFAACDFSDADAAVASASSGTSSGSVITEPWASSAAGSSSSLTLESSSSMAVACLAEITDSTENYIAVWNSCKSLYEKVGKAYITGFDYISSGYSETRIRFWTSSGVVDSTVNLLCMDFDIEGGLCARDTTPGQENPVERLLYMDTSFCDVQTDTSLSCEKLESATFDVTTGMPKSITANFVNKDPLLSVDGASHWEFSNVKTATGGDI